MKDSFKKYFLVPVIIVLVLAVVIGGSAWISYVAPKKETSGGNTTTIAYDPMGLNVQKNGFTFKILDEEVTFPLRLKEDLLDKNFTFMRYDELKEIYTQKSADKVVVLENVNEKLSFGQSYFRATIKDSDKPLNSVKDTDVVGIIVEKTTRRIFSVNGFGCGDNISALIKSFGDGYEVTSEEGTSAEEGIYSIVYTSGNMSVTVTSEDGKIAALDVKMTNDK